MLNDFSKDEQKWLEDWVYVLSKNIDDLLQDNKDDYMTHVAEGMKGHYVGLGLATFGTEEMGASARHKIWTTFHLMNAGG